MSIQRELYNFHQPEQDKLWKIFDDVVKTKRFRQIILKLSNHECGRCAMGVIYSYCLKDGDVHSVIGVPPEWISEFNSAIAEQFHVDLPLLRAIPFKCDRSEKDKAIDLIKKSYKENGVISIDDITILNDYFHLTFEEFRDLFKEMDA